MTTTTTTTKTEFTIPQAQLANGLASVIHAMDNESSRYALAGVRVVIMPGEITFVATDGRRMAWRRIEIDHGLEPIQFTIPAKEAKALARMYSHGNATVSLQNVSGWSIGKIVVMWRNGRRKDQETRFQPLAGRYPKWEQVIADALSKDETGELSGPADLLLPFFAPDEGITITANGHVNATSPLRRIQGKRLATRGKKATAIQHSGEFSVHVSRAFMAEMLSACGESIVTIKVASMDSPVWIECENGLCSVVMPMNIDRN